MKDIRKMRKRYRSHRGVERSDTAYCAAVALVTLGNPIVEDGIDLGDV
eukprot:CAMPEP_0185726006 /NCGR_PEP_ID=MMETSP1171-20130828/2115_1 /TAXON_ID=374046 /ORGANISM="Helicotheca tamensis, Strain CCMP826" /LENGTH=47 /DNA_ID= /DNA_START= /DNA_END= /DNA_ORIENTATION=